MWGKRNGLAALRAWHPDCNPGRQARRAASLLQISKYSF